MKRSPCGTHVSMLDFRLPVRPQDKIARVTGNSWFVVGEQVAARLNVHIGKPRFESNKRRIVHFERQMFFYGSAYGLRPRGYATHRISGSVVLSDINSSLCTNTCLRAHTRYAHIRMYTYRYYSCSLYRFIRTYIDDNADGRKNTNRVSGNACTRMGIF